MKENFCNLESGTALPLGKVTQSVMKGQQIVVYYPALQGIGLDCPCGPFQPYNSIIFVGFSAPGATISWLAFGIMHLDLVWKVPLVIPHQAAKYHGLLLPGIFKECVCIAKVKLCF
ncbi:Hypothetical predicted protein [Podarcis lilfordi]|uniref:Uncharacterized protein n=1 Tax=Podarcis lilfordi TaxID=74358 RepID=A0AA35LLL7_9SAUR|nr:Hypothetical predicted protein [Podarcis lilfordi]